MLLKNIINSIKFMYKQKLEIELKQASKKIYFPIQPNAAGGGNAGSWKLERKRYV